MAYGKGSVGSGELNHHKKMAGAGGSFSVKSPFGGGKATQPGVSHSPLEDGGRATVPGLGRKGGGAMQAAPDHGPMGTDHFRRAGKA